MNPESPFLPFVVLKKKKPGPAYDHLMQTFLRSKFSATMEHLLCLYTLHYEVTSEEARRILCRFFHSALGV